ncbi:hypothetical protein [Chryseobacterium lactis]|uniref:hypothetical protein n=1 Tax=Chryseobacterium lactis TaxID=1241981 RepID=UPI0016262951|nr:hypothetical protein [Chryseobacterium lactis]
MLDGSRDLALTNSNILLWKITGNTLCEYANPIFMEWKNCIDFKLDKKVMMTSSEAGYQIEKLTHDSLIVTQRVDGVDAPDKIKKTWFVNRSVFINDLLNKSKNDSVIIATKDFTPSLKRNILSDLITIYVKKEYSHDLNFGGNILIFPKKQIVKVEIDNEEFQKDQKSISLFKETFSKNYNLWDLDGFDKFEKIIIPYKYLSKLKNGKGETYAEGIVFFESKHANFVKEFSVYVKDKKRSLENFSKAVHAISNNKYDNAIYFFNKAHEDDNTNTESLYNVVSISLALNNTNVACTALKRLKDLEQTEGTKLYKEKCTGQ